MPRLPQPPAEQMKLDSLAEVARGGMGSVELVRVLDGRLAGQIVAVKRLHANIAEDQEFVSMFLDEAWITAALSHPNVAQVMAWGTDDRGPFLAIELVQGVSLSRLLKEAQQNQEPFAERTVAFICSQICAGLTAAHSLGAADGSPLGVVHRDLTPANVLVSFDGAVKIIDFGIAKAEERITHTRTGQLKGKPSYMSPEQQRGGAVDHRADIFAFGVTMFELLAGRRPWTAKGAFDVMMEIANDPHPDLGELRKGLNPEFVAIAHKCLEKKADARFGSAAEIKARLDAWLAAKGFAADDVQSLAHFVQRNSQPQIKWWQEALRGEHAKKKAPTFKELEEKIDAEREKASQPGRRAPPPIRPAAGASTPKPEAPVVPKFTGTVPVYAGSGSASTASPSAPPRLQGTQPMAAYAGPPSSGRTSQAPVSSAPVSSAPMSPAPMSPPVSSGQHPLGGTEFMAASPYAGPPSAASPAQPHHDAHHPLGGTELMAASPYASAERPSSYPTPVSAEHHPFSQRWSHPGPPSAASPYPEPATIPMTPAVGRQTGSGFAPPSGTPVPGSRPSGAIVGPLPKPKSNVALVLVLVLVAIPILGGAAGAWFFRDELLNLGGASAPARAPTKAR